MIPQRDPTGVVWVTTALGIVLLVTALAQGQSKAVPFAQYLRDSAVPKNVIDTFLNEHCWAQFDSELGYILGDYMPRDGLDGSRTLSTTQANGQRTPFLYVNRPCRINTYGDSFTQCHQVSDGETWQEYLAAHLGEPIRNFGMGGYGVYQAYRRMVREEQREHAAQYVIFYIWGDDHIRSLLRCRHASFYRRWDDQGGKMFHNNFWPYVQMDLTTGQWVEKENLLPTRESLYRMTDADWMYEHLKDDLALQMYVYGQGYTSDIDLEAIARLARRLDLSPAQATAPSKDLRGYVRQVLDQYSLAATKYILAKVDAFTRQHGKRLLVVLFDPGRVLPQLVQGWPRYDQQIVDFLREHGFTYFDMNVVHAEDFKCFRLTYEQYRQRYFIGHYNPSGNHFFAFAIKDTIVNWLDPKPITYRKLDPQAVDFQGYLQNSR